MFGAVGNDRLAEANPKVFELFELGGRKIGVSLRHELNRVLQPLLLFFFYCVEYSALPNRKKQLIASDFEGRLWTVDLLLASLSRQHNLRGVSGTAHLFSVESTREI
jgi:hypothetical protein